MNAQKSGPNINIIFTYVECEFDPDKEEMTLLA